MKTANWIGRSKNHGVQKTGRFGLRIAFLILLALALVSSPAAAAKDPNTHSSCMGQEAAGISPPGSSDEVPSGMQGLISFIKVSSPAPGAIVSYIASLHEGSHDACDDVLG